MNPEDWVRELLLPHKIDFAATGVAKSEEMRTTFVELQRDVANDYTLIGSEPLVTPAIIVEPLVPLAIKRIRDINKTMPFPTIFAYTHLHRRTADALQKSGIQYIDMQGNMSIHTLGAYIYTANNYFNGKINAFEPAEDLRFVEYTPTYRAIGTSSPFQGVKLQVILALMTIGEFTTQRSLAEDAGVSVGTASETIASLRRLGFLEQKKLVNEKKGELLDSWAKGYLDEEGLARIVAVYEADFDSLEHSDFTDVSISGELAVPEYLVPRSAVLFVDSWSPVQAAKNRWTAKTNSPNIQIREKFWRGPTAPSAPVAVTYAELLRSGDPRLQEVAEDFRNERIGF